MGLSSANGGVKSIAYYTTTLSSDGAAVTDAQLITPVTSVSKTEIIPLTIVDIANGYVHFKLTTTSNVNVYHRNISTMVDVVFMVKEYY